MKKKQKCASRSAVRSLRRSAEQFPCRYQNVLLDFDATEPLETTGVDFSPCIRRQTFGARSFFPSCGAVGRTLHSAAQKSDKNGRERIENT